MDSGNDHVQGDFAAAWNAQLEKYRRDWGLQRRDIGSQKSAAEALETLALERMKEKHKDLLSRQDKLRHSVAALKTEIGHIDARWWMRWLLGIKRRKVLTVSAHATEKKAQAVAFRLTTLKSEMLNDVGLHDMARALMVKRAEAINHNAHIDEIDSAADTLMLSLQKWRCRDRSALERALADLPSGPGEWPKRDPGQALLALKKSHQFLGARFAQLTRHLSAIRQAREVWSNATGHGLLRAGDLAPMIANGARSLSSTLHKKNFAGLEALLEDALDPTNVPSADLWIALWTAIEASRYCAKRYASPSGEDAGTGQWCAAWEEQMKRWTTDTLAHLRIDSDGVSTAILRTHGVKAESQSGADVLLLVIVDLPGRTYCKAVGIQFKRGQAGAPLFPLRGDQAQQLKTLQRLSDASAMRWTALHAVFRAGAGVLDNLPAVRIDVTVAALARSARQLAAGATYSDVVRAVDWISIAEPLPTALVRELNDEAARFATCGEALDWYANTTGTSNLPAYVLIQAVGAEPELLREQVNELRRSMRDRGIAIDDVQSQRTQGMQP